MLILLILEKRQLRGCDRKANEPVIVSVFSSNTSHISPDQEWGQSCYFFGMKWKEERQRGRYRELLSLGLAWR